MARQYHALTSPLMAVDVPIGTLKLRTLQTLTSCSRSYMPETMKSDMRCLSPLRLFSNVRKRSSPLSASPTSENVSSPTVYDPQASHEKDPLSPFHPFKRPSYECACGHIGSRRGSPRTSHDLPSYDRHDTVHDAVFPPEVQNIIDSTIGELDPDLRQLSLDIWEHPEVGFEEHYAHDRLSSFMERHGFTVTKHYLGLETAWRAEYAHGTSGRVIGLQSEMDALPNIGHACGHNLIAISGVAIALGLKAALEQQDANGKIVLLGTPAEEHGGGKIKLLERGAYKDMDVCIMAHPGPGTPNGTTIQPWIAMQAIEVEFFGHSAHAAYAPWEAQNALDAAFMAYSGISVLRQQMKPSYRVHGIVTGKDWEPNVIPDYSKMRWVIRAPTWPELECLRKKVIACFEGAALSTSCEVKIEPAIGYKDCQQNSLLGTEYVRLARSYYDMDAVVTSDMVEASTDFGDISYALPSIQPVYAIPVQKNGSNHTPQFAESARAPEAHRATLTISKVLAMTALRVVQDNEFYRQVRSSFEERQAHL